MGYAGNPRHDPNEGRNATLILVSFYALALYIAVELNIIILSVFRRRKGLYFWSFLAAINGIIPHSIGFLLKNVVGSHNFGLHVTLVAIGWVPMVTGQSLVLYSRLHLILLNDTVLRSVLAIIIFNAIVLHIPVIILMYGANSSTSNSWAYPYSVYEKVQVTMFSLQEFFISLLYIKSCFSFFDIHDNYHGDAVRKMRRHLVIVNVLVVLLDIPILCLEYANYHDMQTAYKPLVYGVKLRMEFTVLNKLMELTSGRHDVELFRDTSSLQVEHTQRTIP